MLFPPHSAMLAQHAMTYLCSDWAPFVSEWHKYEVKEPSCAELWWCRDSNIRYVMGLVILFWVVPLKEKAVSEAWSITLGGRSGEKRSRSL